MARSCSECWSDLPRNEDKCVRCGAKYTGAPVSVGGLFRSYPWLGVLVAGSFLLTVYALTRRPPSPAEEEIPAAIEPVAAEPAPAEDAPAPEPAPFVFPPPAAEAPAAAPAAPMPTGTGPAVGAVRADGTWSNGPNSPRAAP